MTEDVNILEFPGFKIEIHQASRKSEPRIYFFHQDENILQNLQYRRSRPKETYREFLGPVRQALGIGFDVPIKWRQYAGCSCPCSPGFVVKIKKRVTVYVTLTNVPQFKEDNPNLELRAAALGSYKPVAPGTIEPIINEG